MNTSFAFCVIEKVWIVVAWQLSVKVNKPIKNDDNGSADRWYLGRL